MSFWQLDTWKKLFGGTPTGATPNATGDLSQQVRFIADQFPIGGSLIHYQIFTASGTWTKPAGAKVVVFYIWGAGGGGGGGGVWVPLAATVIPATGGAGGALYTYRALADHLPSSITVTVGAGGTGGAAKVITAGSSGPLDGNDGTSGGASLISVSGVTIGSGLAGGGGVKATTGTQPAPTGSGYTLLLRRHAYQAAFSFPPDYAWRGHIQSDANFTYASYSGAGGGHVSGGNSVLGGGGGGRGGRVDQSDLSSGSTAGGRCATDGTTIYLGGAGGPFGQDNTNAQNGEGGTIVAQGGGGGGAHRRIQATHIGNAGSGGAGALYSGGGGGGSSGSTVSPLSVDYLSGAGGNGGNGLVIVETYG